MGMFTAVTQAAKPMITEYFLSNHWVSLGVSASAAGKPIQPTNISRKRSSVVKPQKWIPINGVNALSIPTIAE